METPEQCKHTFIDAKKSVHRCELATEHDGDGIYDGHVYTAASGVRVRWVEDAKGEVLAVGVEGVTACTTVIRQCFVEGRVPQHFLRNRGRA